MILVVIESPYAGPTPEDVEVNVAYAKRCVHDCLRRGEAPYASHLFFTQAGILDDLVPEERALGIRAGLAWGKAASVVAVYVDRGFSKGMLLGILAASERGAHIEVRCLDREVTKNELKIVFDACVAHGALYTAAYVISQLDSPDDPVLCLCPHWGSIGVLTDKPCPRHGTTPTTDKACPSHNTTPAGSKPGP